MPSWIWDLENLEAKDIMQSEYIPKVILIVNSHLELSPQDHKRFKVFHFVVEGHTTEYL